MELNLTFGDGTADSDGDLTGAALSLYRWLVAEPGLRGQAEVSTSSARPHPGHMGGALEVVNVVLANTIALGSLIVAVGAWRDSRSRPPQVRLERNGVVITLQDGSPETVERILNVWSENAQGTPDPGNGNSG